MADPPPKPDLVEADVDFDPSPPTAQSLCGFKFPPTFSFGFGFNLPALPACLLDPMSCIPFPWLSLNCDLAEPVSAGWGGGKTPTMDTEDNTDQNPFA